MALPPLQGYPRPPADNPRQRLQGAGPSASDRALQRWGEGSCFVPGTAHAQDGAVLQLADAQTPGFPLQAQPTAGLSAALDPQHPPSAEASSFLEELFLATEMEEDTHTFPSGHLRHEEPPGPLEAPLSEEEFHTLLAMLHDSTWPQS